MRGFEIDAIDGQIGRVEGFLFEKRVWIVRYLATTTRGWPFGKRILIATEALENPDRERKTFPVTLTREQVKACAEIDWKKPISRRMELELHEMFEWFPYWNYPKREIVSLIPGQSDRNDDPDELKESYLSHRRELINLRIKTADGELGHTEDLIIDDESWIIRYLLVDTRNWLLGKQVLVAREWIQEIDWSDRSVYVNLSEHAVRNSPDFDPSTPLSREYESELYDHYGLPHYWS
jgi:hypothetical protein